MGESGFHPTVVFDGPYWVHDFSRPSSEDWVAPYTYSVGRYDERRPQMYTTPLFGGVRDHHVGLDLGAPVNTPVHAFASGEVVTVAVNDEDGSYGPTLITKHTLALPARPGAPPSGEERTFWVLYGHLSLESIHHWSKGDRFEAGAILARLGSEDENGGGRRMFTFNFPTTHLLTAIYQAWLRQKIEKLLSRITPTRVPRLWTALLNAVEVRFQGDDGCDRSRVFSMKQGKGG